MILVLLFSESLCHLVSGEIEGFVVAFLSKESLTARVFGLAQLPEDIEEIQAFVSGAREPEGDSTQFQDEPLYQIYHCGAAVRDMHRQNEEGQ